jgi:hypothetical protein
MTVPAEEAFVITVGVPHGKRERLAHCRRALKVLEQAGYRCGATSGDAILALAEQEKLTRALAENDSPEDDGPAAA